MFCMKKVWRSKKEDHFFRSSGLRGDSKILAAVFLLTLLLVTMDMSVAFAQGGGFGGKGGGRRNAGGQAQAMSSEQFLAELSKKLRLKDVQKAEILPVVERFFKKRAELMQSVRTSGEGGKGEMRKQMQQLQLETENQIADFLSDEQLEKYQEFMAEKMKVKSAQRQGRRH